MTATEEKYLSKDYVIALYVRLSEEDDDVSELCGKRESNSITNQRALLNQFVKSRKEFRDCTIVEMCDDGFSGVRSDNRPRFTEMIELAKKGKIHCIIVKDFSRFGRDYVELGDYMEQIFPFLGVRFISVNDGYDSRDFAGGTGGLDIAFKNLVYSYYSRELSRKQKIAWRRLAENGKYNSSHARYGYKKEKNDKHQLVIDEEAAAVVREIFEMFVSGITLIEICRSLNNRGIESPSTYSLNRGEKKAWKRAENVMWEPPTVQSILMDEVYIGNLVQLKTEIKILGRGQVKKPRGEWVRVEHTHEPIISEEVFFAAQKLITREPAKKKHRYHNIYYCGNCGRRLPKQLNGTLRCSQSKYVKDSACKEYAIKKRDADKAVLEAIHLQAKLFLEENEMRRQEKPAMSLSVKEQITAITNTISAMKKSWLSLYDSYADGLVSREDFIKQKKDYDSQVETMEMELALLGKADTQENENADELAVEQAKSILETEELTEDMKDLLIDKVFVYPDNRIEIIWAYEDAIEPFSG